MPWVASRKVTLVVITRREIAKACKTTAVAREATINPKSNLFVITQKPE